MKRCVYTLDALLALHGPGSLCSLAVIHWPLFLSLNWCVSPFHVPNLCHYEKNGNYWAWAVIVLTLTALQLKEPALATPASQLSRHRPSAQWRRRDGVPVAQLVSQRILQRCHRGCGVERAVRDGRYVLPTAPQSSERLLPRWCYSCICGWSVSGWLRSRLPHK